MAKYPTFKEYSSKPAKGIQRCEELLKKTPRDVTLLTVKLQLQCLIPDKDAAGQTLQSLLCIQPAFTTLRDLTTIEAAWVELSQEEYPPPLTAGPEIAKLWENAIKASTTLDQKLDLHSFRFSRAIVDLRLADAQQSLIQLKALVPKNRTAYMAHAALTQMLSKSDEDLSARLALSLARKAVKENFDEDKELDCLVPGQIFALQKSQADLESIKGRRFGDSKQVFRAVRALKAAEEHSNGRGAKEADVKPPTRGWVLQRTAALQTQLDEACSSHREADLNAVIEAALADFVKVVQEPTLQRQRFIADLVFVAIAAVVKLWTIESASKHLLRAAYLADVLLYHQPRIHEAKVFLVYAYSRLGLISLAATQWAELSIKEVQLDTVGHIFMTRLSLSHPHHFKIKKLSDPDPQRILTHALNMYLRLEDKLSEAQASTLNHGQTGMIFDVYDMRQALRKSVTRRIHSLEHRRLARLSGKALNEQFVNIHPQSTAAWLDTIDNRDFKASLGTKQGTERSIYGEGDVKPWLLWNLAADSAWCLMHDAYPAVKDTSKLLDELASINDRGSATVAEQAAGQLVELILRDVYQTGGTAEAAEKLDTKPFLERIAALQVEQLTQNQQMLPTQVSTICLFLDTLKTAIAFTRFAESKKAFTREQGNELRANFDKLVSSLSEYSKTQAGLLKIADVESILQLDDSAYAGLAKSMGKDHLTTFAASIVESSKDAWLAPSMIKV